MRFISFIVMALLASGCSEDPRKVFADMAWKVRCEETPGGCVEGSAHEVSQLDGEDGVDIGCHAESTDSGYAVYIDVESSDGWRLKIDNMGIDEDGNGPVRGRITASVTEGGNIYRGEAGANAPTTDQPCQISNVTTADTDAGRELSMLFQCQHLPLSANNTIKREVGSADAEQTLDETDCNLDNAIEAGCAEFRIVNCLDL